MKERMEQFQRYIEVRTLTQAYQRHCTTDNTDRNVPSQRETLKRAQNAAGAAVNGQAVVFSPTASLR